MGGVLSNVSINLQNKRHRHSVRSRNRDNKGLCCVPVCALVCVCVGGGGDYSSREGVRLCVRSCFSSQERLSSTSVRVNLCVRLFARGRESFLRKTFYLFIFCLQHVLSKPAKDYPINLICLYLRIIAGASVQKGTNKQDKAP